MAPSKFKAPTFPDFFSYFFGVSGCSPTSLNYLLSHWWFSGRILACHAGRPGFEFPPMHLRPSIVRVCRANYFMKFDVSYTGRRSLKGRGHPGLNRSPIDLQLKALPLSYIPVQVAPWLLQNSKHPHFPVFFHFFFALVGALQDALTIYFSHWWFSGRILACHAGDRGFPRQCIYDLA